MLKWFRKPGNPEAGMKYKVGDRVRIITDTGSSMFAVGDIATVTDATGSYYKVSKDRSGWYRSYYEDEIEPVTGFTVGEEYTDKNGTKWRCIHIRENGKAVLDNGTDVIVNYADGSNMDGWDHLDFSFTKSATCGGTYCMPGNGKPHNYRIHFQIVNGKPDWKSAKVTGV